MSLPPLSIATLLKAQGLHPKKGLGQNFLVDPVALQRVVDSAEVTSEDAVLEIGAGLGSLTRELAVIARRVVAVELDRQLFPALEAVMQPFPNVRLQAGDMLALDAAELMAESGYLVVANIPYYITSAIIRHLLEAQHKPRRIVLTVQREVAQRICAEAGDMSLLALSVQVYGAPRVVAHIPSGAFYPPPQVDSAVVRVDLYPEPRIPATRLDVFFRLAKAGFSQKRKTLRNSLSAGLRFSPGQAAEMLTRAGIDPQRRAETLSIDEWGCLVGEYLRQL
ncbi:MAG: 16S rRNA (adenine(1518)-N(6)/adenine(1519)-N(6))-dimethyltransferase RsmA [Anaerolineaceae bacterium]|nr:16S rRNA (adenine(1518)-N(6)/adenine(1519)-N(6))-dimethyltransferase RsmA [Anaerolineaceae bacterium]